MTQTATNPQTGETVVLVGNEWRKPEQTATNAKGEKAYLVGGSWITPQSAPSFGDRAKASLAGVNRGIAGLVGLPVDTAENIVNLGIAGVGSIANVAGRPDLAPDLFRGTPGGSESIAGLMQRVGIGTTNPLPQDQASRLLHTGGIIAGGSLVPGARPLPTAAASAGGAVAGEVLGPEYTGVGAMTPASAVQAAQGAKSAIAARVQPRIDTFKEAGTFPSVGQATESNFIQGFENLLSKFPGGQGVFRQFSEKQQRQLGDTAKTGVSAEDAGRSIEAGIKGFVGRTKAEWQKLDDVLAAKVPETTAIKPTNTLQVLEGLTKPTVGAEKTSKVMSTPKLVEIRSAMASDLSGKPPERVIALLGPDGKTISQVSVGGTPGTETMPFHAIRELRSKVGAMLDDSLVSGIPGGELKRLYGALSADLEAAANGAGAGKEFTRQSNYYRARMTRLEDTLDRVIGRTPEETFARFMPKDAEQANKVRQVMRSLDPEQRLIVQEAVINRLGRATPGKQSEAGDVFSPETFLTNWNKLSPGAKQQLFSDPQMLRNVDAIAKVTDNLRSGAKVFANPSGSAGAAAPYGIGYLAATGDLATAGTLLGGAYIGAKMLTNRAVVDWLAKAPTIKPEMVAAHLSRLGVIYNETKDEALKNELGRYIESVKK